ncbi:MAG: hypothetical protein ACYDHH_28390 [Solirubrobacteraceae bacterium]
MISRVIDEAFEMTRRNVNLVRASEMRAQVDPAFARREQQVHSGYLALMTRLLLQRVEAIGHPNPRRAAAYCAYQVRAVLYYSFVTTAVLGNPLDEGIETGQLARELKDSLLAYLQVAS